jgi:hypothetical protein
MLYEPASRLGDGEQVAVLPLKATLAHRVLVAVENVTLPWPLGFVPLGEVTVAVKVSAEP